MRHSNLLCAALISPAFCLGVGCTMQCPDGTRIQEGTYASTVEERYGEPDISAKTFPNAQRFYVRGERQEPGCGNDPTPLTYYYLDRHEAFEFVRDQLVSVRSIEDDERSDLQARVDDFRKQHDPGPGQSKR